MWDHNVHFHRYLLRRFPKKIGRSLDIGCGLGLFASKLAERAQVVDALDIDSEILKEAQTQHKAFNIYYQNIDFLKADLPKDSYDVIVKHQQQLLYLTLDGFLRMDIARRRIEQKSRVRHHSGIQDDLFDVFFIPLRFARFLLEELMNLSSQKMYK
jgi:SAM-dependent methyltransferase